MTLGKFIKDKLTKYTSDSPELDIQLILAHVIGHPRSWLLAHLDSPLTPAQLESANQAFDKLQAGTPLPHILGHWEFFGLDFEITPDVLIPRPETELLVEKALRWLSVNPSRRSVADVGTGSGIIAVTLAVHVPDIHILATDISSAALKVAKRNGAKFDVGNRIEFVECDLLPSFNLQPAALDLICANLPYIPTDTMRGLPIYGREPTLALDGGADGLYLIRRLLALAPKWLSPNGIILLEIEATQGMSALSLAYDLFSEASISLHQDLSQRDRLLEIQLK